MAGITKNGVRIVFDNNYIELHADLSTPPLLSFSPPDTEGRVALEAIHFDGYAIVPLAVFRVLREGRDVPKA